MHPKIGIVTVLYKSDEVLPAFFESLAHQKGVNFMLYLVDNSPSIKTDMLLAELRSKYSAIQTSYSAHNNIGVAAGNNVGIRQALSNNCDYILLSNNDVEWNNPNLLHSLVNISTQESTDLLVPKILFYDTRKIWCAGGHFEKYRSLGVHDGFNLMNDDPKANIAKDISYSPTCFMLIKADVFEKIGLMDEAYFVYVDDTDFVFRAVQNKLKVWYDPSLTILHKVSSSTGGDDNPFYVYYSNRNKLYFIRKHYDFISKIIAIIHFILTRTVFYFKFDSSKKNALIKAIKDGICLKPIK